MLEFRARIVVASFRSFRASFGFRANKCGFPVARAFQRAPSRRISRRPKQCRTFRAHYAPLSSPRHSTRQTEANRKTIQHLVLVFHHTRSAAIRVLPHHHYSQRLELVHIEHWQLRRSCFFETLDFETRLILIANRQMSTMRRTTE